MSTRTRIGIVSAVAALSIAVAYTVAAAKGSGRGQLTEGEVTGAVDSSTLAKAAQLRVFFGHQSVGANIISGIPAAYEAKGINAPEILEVSAGSDSTSQLPAEGQGFFADAYIGENGDPVGKLEDFDRLLRSGIAGRVDLALMKFCYLDITSATDVDDLFARYQRTFKALERDYPEVTFLHLTSPLTTAPGLKGKIKSILGRGSPSAADNAARERFNALMRDAYEPQQLFDLGAFESTAPDGSRTSGSYEGQPYFSLYDGYAIDEGHLTPLASQLAASQLLALVAGAPA